jgi:carbon-monoxide dehydrogenase large subunit
MKNPVIGQPILRNEDLRLLTGQGQYSDDINLDGQAYAVMVRSPHAHARIRTIDSAAALALPGVLAVLTGKDWQEDGHEPIPHSPIPSGGDGLGMNEEKWAQVYVGRNYPLAPERPRFTGEAVAMVIAETDAIAREATELVAVDYEELPAVALTTDAVKPDAPKVWDEIDTNVCLDTTFGDCAATEAAFAAAHHVTRMSFRIARNTGVPMEPRAGVGAYDPATGQYTLIAGGGGAVRYQVELIKMFGVPKEQIRVVTNDVGGNFGTRNRLFPEYPLVMWAARRLGRPVKNTTDRTECFLTDFQGRDLLSSLELAMDKDGKFLAMKADNISNIGAYTLSFTPLSKGAEIVTGGYAIPCACVRARGVFSHTVPTNPYRSAGRPEVLYALERLVDTAAEEMGVDRVEIRRRNLVTTEAMPFGNPLGMTYDSGEYHTALDRALKIADWDGFANRRTESEARGLKRGLGISSYIESSSGAPRERAEIVVSGDETVEVVIGTQSSGQGHETSFCQVAAEWLGVPFETVTLKQGDTAFVSVGGGSHSGRSMRMAGTVIVMAGDILIEKGKRLAAHVLEAAETDMEFADGTFTIKGTDRSIGMFELAREIDGRTDLPEDLQGGLASEAENLMRTPAFPYGSHICEVEIDPETGALSLERYACVDDVGRVINPVIVDGQIQGGIVQGAGQALCEDFVFNAETGQPLTATLMDYGLPRAADMPYFTTECHEVLTPMNPLGIRSGGEAGTTPAPGCILNAVVDALKDYGVRDVEMPATPLRIWEAIQGSANN